MLVRPATLLVLALSALTAACVDAQDPATELGFQAGRSCGNAVCGGNETCSSCPADCGVCTDPEGPDAGVEPSPDAGMDAGTNPNPIDPDPAPSCPAGNMGPGTAPNGTVYGTVSFPNPTLRNATILWAITGDANDNGVVSVRFRKQGTTGWRRGMPLRHAPAGSLVGYAWTNRQSGSLFDLEPGTTYEVELFLLDPDGGCVVRTATVSTRAVPAPMAGAPIKAATPSSLASVISAAQPGDIIELAGGTYAGFSMTKDGTAGKPIVLREKAGATATINGDLVLSSRKYVHLTGVTVNGRIRCNTTLALSITNNVINGVTATGHGVDCALRSEDNYIADNVITGQTVWAESSLGVDGDNLGLGIRINGPGHVVEHNRVSGFRDCLSTTSLGSGGVDQFSIDFIENDANNCPDDGLEIDYCVHNCRVIRNRFTNVFQMASSQPGFGGPSYFIRNAGYNVIGAAFKLHNGSTGDVMLHNTIVKNGNAFSVTSSVEFSRQLSRNNVFIGGPGGTYSTYSNGDGKVLYLPSAAPSGDYDYDGLGSTTGTFAGRLGASTFASLTELKAETTEKHAVQVTLGIFNTTVAYPANPFPAKSIADLRLKTAGAAVDKGEIIPNVNDTFGGTAPDLGAHELGALLPAYGPR